MREMTVRKWLLMLVIGLMGSALSCRITISNATPPPAPCPIESLLVDESVVPDEWYFSMYGDPSTRFGVEFEKVCFSSQYGGGIQDVYRGRTEREAQRGYQDLAGSWFSHQAELTEWILPSEFGYHSPIADQMQLGCATDIYREIQRCQFIAQYGVYVVRLHADMSEVMTYSDFEVVLRDIDRRMAACLAQQGD
jgi:hypothetical protein